MSDFTKGQWNLDTQDGYIRADGQPIAQVFGATVHNNEANAAESFANARLILEAPRMYELLQMAFFELVDKHEGLALEIDASLCHVTGDSVPGEDDEEENDASLKVCPFCGSKAELKLTEIMEQVSCPKCGASTLWNVNSRELWNNRTRRNTSLKPCPICGKKGKLWQAYDGKYCIQCRNCNITTGYYETPTAAGEAWNRRYKK